MEDEIAIARMAENLRDSTENWWLSICDMESDTALVRTQWTAFIDRFKFSFCKETTRWDTATAYLELMQKADQPPNEYLHAVTAGVGLCRSRCIPGKRRIVSLFLLFSSSLLLLLFGRLSKDARMSPPSPPFYVAAVEREEKHQLPFLVCSNARRF
jgi:hypothetical protein